MSILERPTLNLSQPLAAEHNGAAKFLGQVTAVGRLPSIRGGDSRAIFALGPGATRGKRIVALSEFSGSLGLGDAAIADP